MNYKIIILPGDGIGRDVMEEGIKVLTAVEEVCGLNLELIKINCGGQYYLKTGREWEEGALEKCKDSDAILLGAVGWPGASLPDGNIAGAGVVFGCRFGLDLYANVRPTKLYPNVKHKIHDNFIDVWQPSKVDFVIVRENTEGLYVPIRGGLKRAGLTELTIDNRVITRKGAERVIKFAFELSRKRKKPDKKKKVTCVDKSNVLKGCQLFREIYDEIAKNYPEIEKDYAYIDAFTQWMIRNPEWYDVVVTTNLFGDVITDLASVLQGGMGMAAGGNIGDTHGMFEPIHGSAPKHAGQNKANPIAMVLAIQMLLEWLGEKKRDDKLRMGAGIVEKAVEAILLNNIFTYDLGGKATCSEIGDALKKEIYTIATNEG